MTPLPHCLKIIYVKANKVMSYHPITARIVGISSTNPHHKLQEPSTEN